MSRRNHVWVVERKLPRGRKWHFECVRDSAVTRRMLRPWVGVDGALYRYAKYTLEKP